MADIKIGGKTYSGITTLKIPLADGSGYALFAVDEETGTVSFDSYSVFVPQNVSDEWKVSSKGALDMSTAEFLEMFYDGFVSAPPSGMTVRKNSIGKDESGQYDMWEYDFCPTNYSRTILLSSGMHTYELAASFGLANFIGHLYTDAGNDAFSYIRNNVRVKVVPVVNPWGFNQNPKTYGNVNGVNPNRNFDLDGQWVAYPTYTPSQNEWNVKGEAPFSESEVRNLARWAEANWNAEFWIDCHTGEGYSDKDLWVYYSSDSVILDRINGGISAIEAWFMTTYGKDCVTTRTIDNPDSIRLHWAEKIAGIPGMTLEQAPGRTTFGTSASNEAVDISNYSTNISTFVQEFLMDKYSGSDIIKITSVSADNVSISETDKSVTVAAVVIPENTTQNKFKWTSDDESVCEIYGGTNKAVVVPKHAGSANITIVNRENSAVFATFTVTVGASQSYAIVNNLTSNVTTSNASTSIAHGDGYTSTLTPADGFVLRSVSVVMGGIDITDSAYSDGIVSIVSVTGNVIITATTSATLGASIEGVDFDNGLTKENKARVLTDFLEVAPSSNLTCYCGDGYYIKIFEYDSDKKLLNATLGSFDTNSVSGTIAYNCKYIRACFKKPDASEFTSEDFVALHINVNETRYELVEQPRNTEFPLSVQLGTVNSSGTIIASTTRAITDQFYIPNGAVIEANIPGYYFVFKTNANNIIQNGTAVWFDSTATSTANTEINNVRLLLKKSDDSELAEPIAGTVKVADLTYILQWAS